MVSRKSSEPSPESIARANRLRVAAEEGKKAMVDVARQAVAVRENMARLRSLREAEEIRQRDAGDVPATKKKRKKPTLTQAP